MVITIQAVRTVQAAHRNNRAMMKLVRNTLKIRKAFHCGQVVENFSMVWFVFNLPLGVQNILSQHFWLLLFCCYHKSEFNSQHPLSERPSFYFEHLNN